MGKLTFVHLPGVCPTGKVSCIHIHWTIFMSLLIIRQNIFMCLFHICQMSFILTICPIRSFLSHMICPTNLDLTYILSNGTDFLDNCLVPYSLSNHICPTNVLFGNIVLNLYDNLYVSLLYGSNVLYIDNMSN